MKKAFLAAAVMAVGALTATSATAAPVTQLIHFDDAGNGDKWYSDADFNFLFDPTNLQSSTLCADSTNGGNGSCVIEGTQGVLPKMTRPEFGPTSQGSPNQDPDVSGTDQAFTLDSFYFLLTGQGEGAENAITVTGSNNVTYTFAMGTSWPTNPNVTFYEGANAGDPAGVLTNQVGYIVTFGDLFKDVTWIQFSAPKTAQVRLDCVVATFDGTTTEPLSSFTAGCGLGEETSNNETSNNETSNNETSNVPEPALMSLLGLGLAGAASRLRRRS
jgi:hypothetical protein